MPLPFQDLMARVAREAGATQAVTEKVVRLFIANVKDEAWSQGRCHVPGFLIATVRKHVGRRIREPNTGDSMQLNAGEHVHLRATNHWRSK